jgi:hypothetical protein
MPNKNYTFTIQSSAPAGRRYNAGHWIALGRGVDSDAQRNTAVSAAKAGAPGALKGYLKRYTWADLETTQGAYNGPGVADIAAQLAYAQAQNIQFMPMLEDKTFLHAEKPPSDPQYENPAPAYLQTITIPMLVNIGHGFAMARWDSFYTTRFKALMTFLGNEFDSHANFEGMSIQETALGTPEGGNTYANPGTGKSYQAYSPQRYRDALISQIQHCATAFPRTRLFWHFNFMPLNGNTGTADRNDAQDGVYFNQVIQACLSNICVGGPDSLIDRQSLWDRCYPWYFANKDKVPLFIDYQPDSYDEGKNVENGPPFWTLEEQFQNSIGNNPDTVNRGGNGCYANYIFWQTVTSSHFKYNPDAIAVMNAHKTFNVRSW